MKLASLKEGGRDGTLIVVSRDLARAVKATGIAPTLQRALEEWETAAPRLNALSEVLKPLLNDPARVTTEGRGEDDPVGDNATPEGRAANRRVEIMLAREGTYEAPIAFVPETTN